MLAKAGQTENEPGLALKSAVHLLFFALVFVGQPANASISPNSMAANLAA